MFVATKNRPSFAQVEILRKMRDGQPLQSIVRIDHATGEQQEYGGYLGLKLVSIATIRSMLRKGIIIEVRRYVYCTQRTSGKELSTHWKVVYKTAY
jgi:hypothetical protein